MSEGVRAADLPCVVVVGRNMINKVLSHKDTYRMIILAGFILI